MKETFYYLKGDPIPLTSEAYILLCQHAGRENVDAEVEKTVEASRKDVDKFRSRQSVWLAIQTGGMLS